MPTPPRSPELLKAVWDAFEENGRSKAAAARAMGVPENTYRGQWAEAERRGYGSSPGLREAVGRVGGSVEEASVAWRHYYDENGRKTDTVLLKRTETPPEDIADAICAAMNGIEAVPATPAPARVMADLLTVYPLMDVHFGMLAWGKETGFSDYDIKTATSDMRHALAEVLDWTPDSAAALLLIGGDFFHADDERSETPASKHKLDVDGRHFKVLDCGIQLVGEAAERLLAKHGEVRIRVLRGNHDPHAHMVLTFALSERYRDEPRVTVDKDPRDLFAMQWGKALIAAHHGDRGKPEQLTLYLSDVCEFWSATRHRYCFTGHIHHDRARDTGPLRWESLRAFCPSDSYAAGMGYATRRALQAITFHRERGLVLRAVDPIERATA